MVEKVLSKLEGNMGALWHLQGAIVCRLIASTFAGACMEAYS